jgi:trans-aconitate methyltransferase
MLDRIAVRRRFARAARSYADASRLEAEIGARMLERLDYVKLAPQRVLDAGCGPAREADALAARYPEAAIVLLDAALPMLRLRGLRADSCRASLRSATGVRSAASWNACRLRPRPSGSHGPTWCCTG